MVLTVLLILNGCSVGGTGKLPAVPGRSLTLGLPTPDEDEAIIGAEKALVLMRLNITLDGEPLESPADYVEFGLGSIYWTGLLPVVPKVPSEKAKREGWIYLLLNPGRYNFWILPPGGPPKDYRFQMEVPDKSPIVYMGSLGIACSKSGSCDKPALQRNQEPALELANTYFAYLGKPRIAMMEPYEPPPNRIPENPFPMAVLVQGAPKPLDVIQPERRGTPPRMGNLAAFGGENPGLAVLVLGVIGTLLVIMATGKAIEHFSRDKTLSQKQKPRAWRGPRACQARLLKESAIFQSDPIQLASLVEELKKQGTTRLIELKPDEDLFSKARQQGSRSLLQTGLTTVGLGVAKDASACVQAAVMARLWDVETTNLLYEKILLRRCDGNTTVLSPFLRARFPFGAYDDSHVFDDKSTQYLQSISSACDFRGENRLGAQFSPDGKLLASGGIDHSVILWDVATRRPLGSPLKGHTKKVRSIAFSPDGRLLASGSADDSVIFWDVASRKPLGNPLKGHTSSVHSLAFSPDRRLLASGSADDTVILWDVATRRPLGNPLKGHKGSVYGLAFSPDGTFLASGGADKAVILWDVVEGKQTGKSLEAHESSVDSVAFSPDGKLLASGSFDNTVIFWDMTNRTQSGEPLKGHKSSVHGVTFSPDGKLLASGSNDNTVILWDVANRTQSGEPLKGHKSSVHGVTFSPDGRLLASGSTETVLLWDVTSRAPVAELIEEPTAVRQTLTSAMDTATRIIVEDFQLGTKLNNGR